MTSDWGAEAWKGDGLKVDVLYSRAGVATQILVSSDEGDILLDVGDGTLRDLLMLEGYEFSRLKGAAISHGHCDHMGGLWSLLGLMRILARKEDFTVAIPEGSREPQVIVSEFIECYRDTLTFQVKLVQVRGGSRFRLGPFELEAHEMVHRGSTFAGLGAPIPALGYSIGFRGQRIAFSGDTDYGEHLERLARGADLAIIEASWAQEKHLGHEGVHLTAPEALKAARLAKDYRLIHFTKGSKAYLESKGKP